VRRAMPAPRPRSAPSGTSPDTRRRGRRPPDGLLFRAIVEALDEPEHARQALVELLERRLIPGEDPIDQLRFIGLRARRCHQHEHPSQDRSRIRNPAP
jgi:hypothetical protein